MHLKRLKAIAKKETKQLLRDRKMLFLLLFFPVFLLWFFGYAVNFDVKDIRVAVLDKDGSSLSRNYYTALFESDYFLPVAYLQRDSEIQKILDSKTAQCVIVIPHGFSMQYYRGETSQIQYLIDGVDANTATIIQGYMQTATLSYNASLSSMQPGSIRMAPPVTNEPLFLYNPDLQTTKFMLPGLITFILIISSTISVALTLVREKERGTMEQINISPVRSSELLLGKLAPYLVIALINTLLILIIGYLVFNIVVKGSLLILFISVLLYLFTCIMLGIFVSTFSDSQQVAFTVATFVSLLPSLILSGFIFQIESMPPAVQLLTYITPATYFNVILRAIILRGVGIEAYWSELVSLLIFGTLLLGLSLLVQYKKDKNL